MQFQLTIKMDNAAFSENTNELSDIVTDLAERLEDVTGPDSGPVRDSNGNTVGSWEVTS